ncbi:YqhG family protein [Alicyclobacillus macrosporangiidus]|uniref:YqhG family protein n=1 Tax=Alicyclobacillus macrosporangiidus TaxID=392015 RepID=UPI00068F81E5|nr:YqhG family protein [Alicyclobacillus macrosporangiidus]
MTVETPRQPSSRLPAQAGSAVQMALPLRTAEERMRFCDAYFAAVGAPVVYEAPFYREYQLPRDVDKELTDRPYYWLWVEKTQKDVPPTVLRLAFEETALERENERLRQQALRDAEHQGLTELQRRFFRPPTAEWINLGCFRLDKIFQSLDRRGQFACVAPRHLPPNAVRVPWLMLNLLVSFRCDLTQQEFWSIGVCLVNGQVVERFLPALERLDMVPLDKPAEAFLSGTLSLEQAWQRVARHVERRLAERPHDWADAATRRWLDEREQVRTYYRSILPDVPDQERTLVAAEQARKERELEARMRPRIEVELRQVALVILAERPTSARPRPSQEALK